MNSSKKLVYIANLRLPTEKAYGIQIAKMCEAFADAGLNVTLIFPRRKNPNIKKDVFEYYSIKKNFRAREVWAPDFYWPGFLDKIAFIMKSHFSAKALINEALKENADIYYTRDEQIAYVLSKQNKNIVFEGHRFSNKKKPFYHHFKKIIAISEGLKEDLIKFGIKGENILVARDGVDLREFDIEMSKETARDKVGLPLDKKVVMYTGHLFEWKGADVLAMASELISDALFVFVGGTEHDVNNFRDKYGSKNNIKIIGFKPHNEIPVYMKAADVLVLPNSAKEEISRFYTSPLKLFEYMASKKPIVASDLPSIREVLNETSSLLVKPDDPDALAEGIKKILDDPELAKNISNKAFGDVQGHTWLKRAGMIINSLFQFRL